MLHPLSLADIGPIPSITESHSRTMFLVFGSIAVVVVFAALADAVRRRSTLPLFCLVGSVLCNPVEPVWDALGNLRFHHGNVVAFVMFPELSQPIEYPWWAAAAVARWGSRAYPLAIVIVPSSFAAWELWAGWPMFAALHADVSPLVLNLAALFTAVIAVGTIWVLGRVALPAAETAETRRTVSQS
jgi:hypothetical protein